MIKILLAIFTIANITIKLKIIFQIVKIQYHQIHLADKDLNWYHSDA
jgi:hypothetical protein